MSEIRANTISDAAGTGPVTLTKQYAAKAWVNFNGTGTVAIRDSENISSISDNGAGSYSTNYTNNFAAQNYALGGMAGRADNSLSSLSWVIQMLNPQEGYSRFQTKNDQSDTDSSWVNTCVFGDLA